MLRVAGVIQGIIGLPIVISGSTPSHAASPAMGFGLDQSRSQKTSLGAIEIPMGSYMFVGYPQAHSLLVSSTTWPSPTMARIIALLTANSGCMGTKFYPIVHANGATENGTEGCH